MASPSKLPDPWKSTAFLQIWRHQYRPSKATISTSLCALSPPPNNISLSPSVPLELSQLNLPPSSLSPPTLYLSFHLSLSLIASLHLPLRPQTNWGRWPPLFPLSKPLSAAVARHLDYIVCVCVRECVSVILLLFWICCYGRSRHAICVCLCFFVSVFFFFLSINMKVKS